MATTDRRTVYAMLTRQCTVLRPSGGRAMKYLIKACMTTLLRASIWKRICGGRASAVSFGFTISPSYRWKPAEYQVLKLSYVGSTRRVALFCRQRLSRWPKRRDLLFLLVTGYFARLAARHGSGQNT